MARIVGVHGVRNYQELLTPEMAASALADNWSRALGTGDDLVMAYYAHHLQDAVAQGPGTPEDLDEEATEMLYAWANALADEPKFKQGNLMRGPRYLIERMTGNPFTGLVNQLFILIFIREVQLYLGKRHRQRRLNARDEVARTIRRHNPRVVIAHSLGSVVAYEALWSDPALEVDLLVTMGSPLAMPRAIYHRLEPAPPANGTLTPRPPGVRRWVNLADPGDVCAVPRWLKRFFAVDDDREHSIGVLAFHDALSYLASEGLAEILYS
ncbi:serine peptidase [Actinocrispum sp. NPDC049592]|uniref:serine peptidase n=1 Tax=Actinocrispum sp. NPDC049592 TaxID=3154835 RepID=UPI003435AA3E